MSNSGGKKCLRYQIFCHNDNFFRRSNNFRIKIPAYQPRNARNTEASSQKTYQAPLLSPLPFLPPFSSFDIRACRQQQTESWFSFSFSPFHCLNYRSLPLDPPTTDSPAILGPSSPLSLSLTQFVTRISTNLEEKEEIDVGLLRGTSRSFRFDFQNERKTIERERKKRIDLVVLVLFPTPQIRQL